MKRVFVLILTLALLCSFVPVIAESEIIEIEPNLMGLLRNSGYTTCSDLLESNDIRTVLALLLMLDVCLSSNNPHSEYTVTDYDTSCIYVGRLNISELYAITCTDDGKYSTVFTYDPSSNSINVIFVNMSLTDTTSNERNSIVSKAVDGAISRYKIDEEEFFTAIDVLLSIINN